MLNDVAGILEHFQIGTHVVEVRYGSVAGDNLHVGRKLRDDPFDSINHAVHAASAVHVNEGEPVSDEIISHMNDVGFREEDDGVAVRVTGGKVKGADVIPIEVDGHVVIEGYDGQRFSGLWLGFQLH